jgi:hypothetical protein
MSTGDKYDFGPYVTNDADWALAAGAEIDRLKWKVRNQRRELRRLNKLVHEHTSRAQSAGTKAQQRAIQVAVLERQVKALTEQNAGLIEQMSYYIGGRIVQTY